MGERGRHTVERGAYSAAREVDGAQLHAIGDANPATSPADPHIEHFLAVSRWYLGRDLTPTHQQRPAPSPKTQRPWLVHLGIGRAWPTRQPTIVDALRQRAVRLWQTPDIEKSPRGGVAARAESVEPVSRRHHDRRADGDTGPGHSIHGREKMKRDRVAASATETGGPLAASSRQPTLIGARLRWMGGMLKAFAGEATGNPQMELEGTLTKLVNRIDMDNLARRRALGAPLSAQDGDWELELYDITLHERAARQLELAAERHRQAVRSYRAGDHEQGHYHAFIAQSFFSDAREIATELGKVLWRSLESRR